jgi:tetratricopeptide (TPR) repeat protein
MKNYIIIVLLVISSINIKLSANPQEDSFTKGTELFSSGKIEEALVQWKTIYDQGYRSAALDYNIGNAYFKLNKIPDAILYYEKALLLSPGDEDINYNLGIARTFVVDRFDEIPELFFIRWFNFISLGLSTNKWAIISLTSFILFLVLGSLFLYSSKYKLKIFVFWTALFFIVLSSLSFSFALRNKKLIYDSGKAIITSPVINGKSSPDNSGTDLFVLHEGTKVTIEDEFGEWTEVRLSDGNIGWVTSDCLNKI